MTHTHNIHPEHNREHKRAQFAEPRKERKRTTSILVTVFVAVAGVAVYLVVSSLNNNPAPAAAVVAAKPSPAQNEGLPQNASASGAGDIAIPISDVSSGNARFFDYKASDNRSVRFFVIKSSDGVYRAALDACDVCYAGRKGYHQEGDNMICNKCGRQFPSALVNEVTGGCNPIGVARTVEGDKIVIRASEFENRKAYF